LADKRQVADVCFVLEGTYPFVQGGVSTWVHNLIAGIPSKTFHILTIGATPDEKYERKYELPPNVVGVDQVFLLDFRKDKLHTRGPVRGKKDAAWDLLTRFHDEILRTPGAPLFDEIVAAIGHPDTRSLSLDDLFTSQRSWEFIRDRYERKGNNASYIDFFWTWRITHLPLFQMMQADLPPARVYHTASTGYAGFLASVAKQRTGRPLIVTEHGIYTHERKIEIAQAEWIYVKQTEDYKIRRTQSFFKQWWINIFRLMSNICYQEADRIITITQVNQPFQLGDGADPSKMSVIPNGIRIERFAAAREGPRPDDQFVVGFVGRVVPIKDVKTFIRAIKIAVAAVPNLKAYVIGPTDEDEEYFAECQRLTRLLGLEERLIFTGRANVLDYYRQMHALVLTSISEAQPLVILEGHCAGVPVIATNVGACQELLYGRTPEDQALGPSGIVTAVASPGETAEAIAKLANNPQLRDAMVESGIQRVETFYREEDLNETYLELYHSLGMAPTARPNGPGA
jgi:glycosyltransferase involved in cell wall biosynthesis